MHSPMLAMVKFRLCLAGLPYVLCAAAVFWFKEGVDLAYFDLASGGQE